MAAERGGLDADPDVRRNHLRVGHLDDTSPVDEAAVWHAADPLTSIPKPNFAGPYSTRVRLCSRMNCWRYQYPPANFPVVPENFQPPKGWAWTSAPVVALWDRFT